MGGFFDLIASGGLALGGVASGGLLSLVTAGVRGIGRYVQRRQELQARREEWEREERLEQLRQQGVAQEAENEYRLTQTAGSWTGLEASYRGLVPAGAVSGWVNNLRALFRPVLTLVMLGLVGWFFHSLLGNLNGDNPAIAVAFTPDEAGAMVRSIVDAVVYTAMTAVAWWFGDRALQAKGGKP